MNKKDKIIQTLKLKLYFYVLFYILFTERDDGQIIYLTKIKYIIIYNG